MSDKYNVPVGILYFAYNEKKNTVHKYCIGSDMYVHTLVVKSPITKNTVTPPSVHNLIPPARGFN